MNVGFQSETGNPHGLFESAWRKKIEHKTNPPERYVFTFGLQCKALVYK